MRQIRTAKRLLISAYSILFASIALGAPAAEVPSSSSPVVTTSLGDVRGGLDGETEYFKGIPFALPPVGALRWRSPLPAIKWLGTREATIDAPDCAQAKFNTVVAPLNARLSEDCLYLNVWRPTMAGRSKKLPVIVWLHGGGFTNGGISAAAFDGSSFARDGLVFVSVNYRLGRFGFFGFPSLSDEQREGDRYNYGIQDQIAALRWIKRNISAFGGDSGRVTLFGESAGGASILLLMHSPAAKGLFANAIVQSGGGEGTLVHAESPEMAKQLADDAGVNFARKHGIVGTGRGSLSALRSLAAADIIDDLAMNTLQENISNQSFVGPIVDGSVIRPGKQAVNSVPTIIGATNADIGMAPASNKDELFSLFGERKEDARTLYDPNGDLPLASLVADVGGDRTMRAPARAVATALGQSGVSAWLYRFSYVASAAERKGSRGAAHASDVPFVMDTLVARYGSDVSDRDNSMSRAMHGYWVNFAKQGNPNGSGLPEWPAYSRAQDHIMNFDADGSAEFVSDPIKKRLDLLSPN